MGDAGSRAVEPDRSHAGRLGAGHVLRQGVTDVERLPGRHSGQRQCGAKMAGSGLAAPAAAEVITPSR